jgi:FkbM family methyltransferase
MLNNCDDGLVQYFYYGNKYHEDADLKLFMTLSKKSNCIFDIGANTGLFSILSSKTNSHSKIFAFEPYSVNASRMKINLQLNNINNVMVVEEAIGNEIGEINITTPYNKSITDVASANHEFSKSIYKEVEWEITKVPSNTLDNFSKSIPAYIDLIKCDVESFEIEVFNGMKNVLNKSRPTIIFECFLDENRKNYFNQILDDYNYFLYLILEQGIVYCKEGFKDANFSLNYLISPVKPVSSFISYADQNLADMVLQRPIDNINP